MWNAVENSFRCYFKPPLWWYVSTFLIIWTWCAMWLFCIWSIPATHKYHVLLQIIHSIYHSSVEMAEIYKKKKIIFALSSKSALTSASCVRSRGGVPPLHAAVPRGAAPRGAPPSRAPSSRGRGVQRARGAPPTAGYRQAPPIVQDTYGEYVSILKLCTIELKPLSQPTGIHKWLFIKYIFTQSKFICSNIKSCNIKVYWNRSLKD